MISEHLTELAGKKVEQWEVGQAVKTPSNITYRISLDYDSEISWVSKFQEFLKDEHASESTGFVVGAWEEAEDMGGEKEPTDIVEALVKAKDTLQNLKALFFGDIISEESEISWITNTDLSPLLETYPKLEYLGIRGGNSLSLDNLKHAGLKTLLIQSGGLDVSVVKQVASADLPQLTHLELYLGSEDYGANHKASDLEPILQGKAFPKLTYLGLRDSELADEIALAIANSPIINRIEVLDLSLGTLTDKGAKAFLESPAVKQLKKLDLHYHWCSDEMTKKLADLGNVDVSDQQEAEDDDWRYVAIGE